MTETPEGTLRLEISFHYLDGTVNTSYTSLLCNEKTRFDAQTKAIQKELGEFIDRLRTKTTD